VLAKEWVGWVMVLSSPELVGRLTALHGTDDWADVRASLGNAASN